MSIEGKLFQGLLALSLGATGCTTKVHVRFDVLACVSPPDGSCDMGDTPVGGDKFAVGLRDNSGLIYGATDNAGHAAVSGDFESYDLRLFNQGSVKVENPDGSQTTLCPNSIAYQPEPQGNGSYIVKVDVTFGSCDPAPTPVPGNALADPWKF